MLTLLIFAFFLLVEFLLIVTTRINIYPEFFLLPWLVQKGFIPYRDFFDHHGFILYYILAPLSTITSLKLIEYFYIFLKLLDVTLMMLILKKTTSRAGFIIGVLLFICLNFYLSGNNLWYEDVILTIFLVIYCLCVLGSFPLKSVILAALILLSSFIKPIAGIVLLPVLFITKKRRILVYFLVGWLLAGLYFLINNGFHQAVEALFRFNLFYGSEVRKQNLDFTEASFKNYLVLLMTLSFVFNLVNKILKENLRTLVFLLSSLVFISIGIANRTLLPIVPFAVLFITTSYKNLAGKSKILFTVAVIFFLVFIARKTKHQYFLNQQNIPYIETHKEYLLNKLRDGDERIYVLGNQVEIYYLNNKLPPTYFPLLFPLIIDYFQPEDRIIQGIKQAKVEYVLIPQPLDENYKNLTKLRNYIKEKYIFVRRDSSIEYYRKRR